MSRPAPTNQRRAKLGSLIRRTMDFDSSFKRQTPLPFGRMTGAKTGSHFWLSCSPLARDPGFRPALFEPAALRHPAKAGQEALEALAPGGLHQEHHEAAAAGPGDLAAEDAERLGRLVD